jgi:hypothetical protein
MEHVDRSLTLPASTLRVDGGARWAPYGPDGQLSWIITPGANQLYLNPAVTFGIIDDFELGFVVPTLLAPDVALPEFRIHGLYRFLPGKYEVGIFWQASAAIESDAYDLWLLGGVAAGLHFSDTVRLDTGAFLQTVFSPGGPDANLYLQAALPVQLGKQWFIGPETSISAFLSGDDTALMLGAFGGYTLPGSTGTLGDLSVRLRFLDIADTSDVLQLIFAADLYFDL